MKIATTLVTGKTAIEREEAIAAELATYTAPSAVLIEGLSDGRTCLTENDQLVVARIASGCLCCSNNMIMRIYLNRLIQQKPQRLFISLSTDAHLVEIKQFLSTPDYAGRLTLSKILKLK